MTSLAFGLGLVHGRVRIADNLVRAIVPRVTKSNADAGTRHNVGSLDDIRLLDRVLNALRQFDHPFIADIVFDKHSEFIPAKPRHGTLARTGMFEPAGDFAQHIITALMPVPAIDGKATMPYLVR